MRDKKQRGLPASRYEPDALALDRQTPDWDKDKYLPEIEDLDITEAQKIELLETLWSIMCSFVEMGFTVNLCEQFFDEFNEASGKQPDDGKLLPSPTTETRLKRNGKETPL